MKEQNFKKLGFFSAFAICIGSIVGIGIFFKNGSIASNVGGDGVGWISTWVISGIIALLVAVHFGKIARVKNASGLSSWAQRVSTNKQNWFRHAVTTNYSFFYNSIMMVVLSFFSVEIFFSFLNNINPSIEVPLYVIAIVSLVMVSFLTLMNKLSVKASGRFALVTTFLKFIPLLIVMIVGIVLPNTHHAGGENGFIPGTNGPNSFESFQGVMKSLPAALFAFDAFAGVGSMSRKVKGGQKVVSKVIVLSMLLVVIAYLLISISAILHVQRFDADGNLKPSSSIDQMFGDIFGSEVAYGMKIFVSLFLFISAAGTTNAIGAGTLSEFENISFSEKIFYSRQMNLKFGHKTTGLIYYSLTILFWALVAYIPAIIMNSDSFIDGLSNFPVFFFFLVYAIMIFLYWKNIFKPKFSKGKNLKNQNFLKTMKLDNQNRLSFKKGKIKDNDKSWVYTVLVMTSVIGVFLALTMSIIFTIVAAVNNPFDNSNWGFMRPNPDGTTFINNLTAAILYLVFIAIFVLLPTINYLLFWIKNEKNIFEDIDVEIYNQKQDEKTLVIETRVFDLY